MRSLAEGYPRVFAGLIFAVAALPPSGAAALFFVLILRAEGLIAPASGVPYDAYLFAYILFLPPLCAGVVAAALGRRLAADPALGRGGAAGLGAGIAAVSYGAWALAGELLWLGVGFPAPNPADVGVIDFLATLAYGLMALVFLVVVLQGAAVGVGLRAWVGKA